MAERLSFQDAQYAFAAHIRDPDGHPPPAGIEDRRMAVYRELFFNNLYKLTGSTFPVLRKLYGDDGWRRLVRAFMRDWRARTPYFLELPREFLRFLNDRYELAESDPPFLRELAHYEWAELALAVSDARNDSGGIDPHGDLCLGVPVKSVHAWLLDYRWPVHRISVEFRPDEPGEQPTWLTIYRRADDEIGYMELNAVTARLLEMIDNNDAQANGEALLLQLAGDIGWPEPASLVEHGRGLLRDMRNAEILLGTRRAG